MTPTFIDLSILTLSLILVNCHHLHLSNMRWLPFTAMSLLQRFEEIRPSKSFHRWICGIEMYELWRSGFGKVSQLLEDDAEALECNEEIQTEKQTDINRNLIQSLIHVICRNWHHHYLGDIKCVSMRACTGVTLSLWHVQACIL